jgi:hypothetical protein
MKILENSKTQVLKIKKKYEIFKEFKNSAFEFFLNMKIPKNSDISS